MPERAACFSEQKENNEKTSNSWNSFGSLGCIGISMFGYACTEHEHSADQTGSITDGNRKSGSIAGRISCGHGQEERRE